MQLTKTKYSKLKIQCFPAKVNFKSLNIRFGCSKEPSHMHPTLKSDVNLSFALVNITVLGLTNPDIYLKRRHQLYNSIIFRILKKP